jgi:hypothetical protein
LPTVARGDQKQYEPGRLLETWYLAVFQKKLGTKLFFFTLKKISLYLFLLSFGPRVHFQSKKLIFWQKYLKWPKKEKNYHPVSINKKVAHSTQESPKKN